MHDALHPAPSAALVAAADLAHRRHPLNGLNGPDRPPAGRRWSMALWLLAIGSVASALAQPAAAAARQTSSELATLHDFCDSDRVKEAVSLVYEHDRIEQALALAQRCERAAVAQSRPFDHTIATRIQAVVAMRLRDMPALKTAGETLIAQAQVAEYVADGHMFVAFACLFSGDAACARTHLDTARSMFTELAIPDALAQLRPMEQTLAALEAQQN